VGIKMTWKKWFVFFVKSSAGIAAATCAHMIGVKETAAIAALIIASICSFAIIINEDA
jgi:hypothetical protein